MIKTMAIILVATAFILTGQYLNLRMHKRISSLNKYVLLIEGINSQISFSKKNIRDIISELTADENIKLRAMCELNRMSNIDFSDSWKKVIKDFSQTDGLSESDEKILISFGQSLGLTDQEGQKCNCRLHIEMLRKQLDIAERNLKEKSRITTAVSVFAAVAAVTIFY